MDNEQPDSNPNETPEKLSETRLPERLTPSEKEAFEGKIEEQAKEIASLKAEIAELKKPKLPPKAKSFLKRFEPL